MFYSSSIGKHIFYYDIPNFNIIQWLFFVSPSSDILRHVINEMVKRIHSHEKNIFSATGPTLITDVIKGLIRGNRGGHEQSSTMIRNMDFAGGFLLPEPGHLFSFRMDDIGDKLYDKNHSHYEGDANPEYETPHLYKKYNVTAG